MLSWCQRTIKGSRQTAARYRIVVALLSAVAGMERGRVSSVIVCASVGGAVGDNFSTPKPARDPFQFSPRPGSRPATPRTCDVLVAFGDSCKIGFMLGHGSGVGATREGLI